mmetsp:Transcript_33726/g.52746  ORF Transcript_33726/g.52746 Transcript_33726/m.52746 type:complete len:262 (-) Transcript_33726:31-816(-)
MLLFLRCVDPALGKVDKASLSQEVLMELFIGDIEYTADIVGNATYPAPMNQWKGVVLNSSEEVISIDWWAMNLHGKIPWEWIPVTVTRICINKNHLSGTLNLTVLPDGFRSLEVASNDFSGSIDLCHLPATMVTLMLYNNRLRGTVNLENLPSSMKLVVLKLNRFVGELCFTKLPENLRVLDVAENKFSGVVDLTSLPCEMTQIVLHNNDFSGETDFSKLPETLTFIDISFTNLSGEILPEKKLVCKSDGTKVVIKQRIYQ